jgi:hypothetical protein
MHDEILRCLLAKLADFRYEVRREKARRYPFRVFDRKLNKSTAQFDTQDEADSHRVQLISSFVRENYDAIHAQPGVWLNANDRDVPTLLGQCRQIPATLSLPSVQEVR